MTLTRIALLICSLFVGCICFAQNNFILHMGTGFPTGEFASDDFDDEAAGRAAIGFTIGGVYTYVLNDKGLGLFVGIDFMTNGLQKQINSHTLILLLVQCLA